LKDNQDSLAERGKKPQGSQLRSALDELCQKLESGNKLLRRDEKLKKINRPAARRVVKNKRGRTSRGPGRWAKVLDKEGRGFDALKRGYGRTYIPRKGLRFWGLDGPAARGEKENKERRMKLENEGGA